MVRRKPKEKKHLAVARLFFDNPEHYGDPKRMSINVRPLLEKMYEMMGYDPRTPKLIFSISSAFEEGGKGFCIMNEHFCKVAHHINLSPAHEMLSWFAYRIKRAFQGEPLTTNMGTFRRPEKPNVGINHVIPGNPTIPIRESVILSLTPDHHDEFMKFAISYLKKKPEMKDFLLTAANFYLNYIYGSPNAHKKVAWYLRLNLNPEEYTTKSAFYTNALLTALSHLAVEYYMHVLENKSLEDVTYFHVPGGGKGPRAVIKTNLSSINYETAVENIMKALEEMKKYTEGLIENFLQLHSVGYINSKRTGGIKRRGKFRS